MIWTGLNVALNMRCLAMLAEGDAERCGRNVLRMTWKDWIWTRQWPLTVCRGVGWCVRASDPCWHGTWRLTIDWLITLIDYCKALLTQPATFSWTANQVPASAGVMGGTSPLSGGRYHCVIQYGTRVPLAVRRIVSCYACFNFNLTCGFQFALGM